MSVIFRKTAFSVDIAVAAAFKSPTLFNCNLPCNLALFKWIHHAKNVVPCSRIRPYCSSFQPISVIWKVRPSSGDCNPGFLQKRTWASLSSPLLQPPRRQTQVIRFKSRKQVEESDSGSDTELENDALDDDDFDAPAKFKVKKIHLSSLRADTLISNGLDISRNRLEEVFFGSGLYVNGEKILKKSAKMDEGDYADFVMERTEDQLKVKRVKLLRVYPSKTSTGKFLAKIRVWKAPFLIDAPGSSARE